VHLAYSYALILAGAVALFRSALRYPRHYRGQGVLIMMAVAAPWIANILYAVDLVPDDNFDPTPFAFAVTGGLLALALSRYRLLHLFLGLRSRARSAIIETMRDGVVVLDRDGQVIDFNPAASMLLGTSSAELFEARMKEVLRMAGIGPLGNSADIQSEVRLGEEAEQRIFDVVASPLGGQQTDDAGRLVVLRDITKRKRAEEAALEIERRYKALVDNAHDLIVTLDRSGHFTSANAAAQQVVGYSGDELLTFNIKDLISDDSPEQLDGNVNLPLLDNAGARQELKLKSKHGKEIVLEASVRGAYKHGQLYGYECIARDVTETRQWEDALRFQALHDSVTNLPNRMHFRERLAYLVGSSHPASDRFAVYVLDLDRFKEINDILGHQSGDALLEVVAARLERSLRAADTVARLGGDEFALVVGVADIEEAQRVAQRVLEVFRSPFKVDQHELVLSASVGVALFPIHGRSVDSLLRFADIAMYAAKQAGGARYAIYELDENRYSPDRLTLQSDLHAAFSKGELTLHYQP
jgi:diguanylate cyclase (GGDEF)-like protein/PAS domain S-box-containing protein